MSSLAANRLKRELLELCVTPADCAGTCAGADKRSVTSATSADSFSPATSTPSVSSTSSATSAQPPAVDFDSFDVQLQNASLFHLQAQLHGPPDTPYAGGRFRLDIRVPDRYPFVPPAVRFVTRIWHPNISSATGAICLDILKDKWAAAMTIRSVLLSIQALLQDAEPNNPQDAIVAGQYKRDPAMFKATAEYWTAAFAGGRSLEQRDRRRFPLLEAAIDAARKLVGRATDEQLILALSGNDWDAKRAKAAF